MFMAESVAFGERSDQLHKFAVDRDLRTNQNLNMTKTNNNNKETTDPRVFFKRPRKASRPKFTDHDLLYVVITVLTQQICPHSRSSHCHSNNVTFFHHFNVILISQFFKLLMHLLVNKENLFVRYLLPCI